MTNIIDDDHDKAITAYCRANLCLIGVNLEQFKLRANSDAFGVGIYQRQTCQRRDDKYARTAKISEHQLTNVLRMMVEFDVVDACMNCTQLDEICQGAVEINSNYCCNHTSELIRDLRFEITACLFVIMQERLIRFYGSLVRAGMVFEGDIMSFPSEAPEWFSKLFDVGTEHTLRTTAGQVVKFVFDMAFEVFKGSRIYDVLCDNVEWTRCITWWSKSNN